jgi:putative acetyltransferase
MIKIRKSRDGDGERTVEIWRSAVDATHHFLTPVDRLTIDDEVQAFLPSTPSWLAVDENDRGIGFMLVEDGVLEALFVDPAFHGRGVGRALVEQAILLSSTPITTDVNEQNPLAIGFYGHLGFHPIGRSPNDGQGRAYPLIHMRLSELRTLSV